MKQLFIFLSFFCLIQLSAQTEYVIDNFSEKYYAKLTIDKGFEDDVFKQGNIRVFNKSTKTEIIKIESEEFTIFFDEEGNINSNIVQLPYGEQSNIICDDFDFDGVKDLAIMDGQFGCYHGPSFQVYLEKNNNLVHSPEFTELAHGYCGMFETDHKSKVIRTMTKSGCCWHEFSEFKVVNGIPKPTVIVVEELDGIFHVSTTTEWKGEEKIVTVEKTLETEYEDIKPIISFELQKNRKKVSVFAISDYILTYLLIKPNELVEFNYPIEGNDDRPDFILNKHLDRLTFTNKDATYEVYETVKGGKTKTIGVLVKVNGKTYDLKGDVNSLEGTLKNLSGITLENLGKE